MHDLLLVAGPLVAVWLTNWLTRGREVRQWRRDRCLEAYADILQGCEAVVNKATELYLEEFDDIPKRQALIEQIAEFHRAQHRAALLAPAEMEATLLALVQHTEQKIAIPAGKLAKPSLEEWTRLTTTDIAAIAGQFYAQARSDLTVHPSSIGVQWGKMLRRTPRA